MLETPRVWILCTLYVAITVTLGYPLVTGLASAAFAGGGLDGGDLGRWGYLTRFLDAAIYVFLPQLGMLLVRAIQKRPLLHRMTGRSVVIGDCPWVAQSAEAYLSKIFACAYSATSIAVCSANPADHLVHRMTHRVVRGVLLVCGRPDGRLTALTTLENTVCLSVNQASSIQSLGVTCESLTIGHNPFQLPLTADAVTLRGNRPDYLCERLLHRQSCNSGGGGDGERSAGALLGEFSNMRDAAGAEKPPSTMEEKMAAWGGGSAVRAAGSAAARSGGKSGASSPRRPKDNLELRNEAKRREELRLLFDEIDDDGYGTIDLDEFVRAIRKLGGCNAAESGDTAGAGAAGALSEDELRTIFADADADASGALTCDT